MDSTTRKKIIVSWFCKLLPRRTFPFLHFLAYTHRLSFRTTPGLAMMLTLPRGTTNLLYWSASHNSENVPSKYIYQPLK